MNKAAIGAERDDGESQQNSCFSVSPGSDEDPEARVLGYHGRRPPGLVVASS